MRLPKFIFLGAIFLFLLYSSLLGQKKVSAEVDVSKCWSYPLGDDFGEQVVSDGRNVFLAAGGAKVEALSLDGKKVWSSEFGGEVRSNILAADRGLFLVTSTVSSEAAKSSGGKLRALSNETGITSWTLSLPYATKYWLGKFNGTVIAVSKNGAIEAVNENDGGVKWKREIAEGFVAEPLFTAGYVTVATIRNRIFYISMATGEIESMRKVPFGITSLSETKQGMLLAGDERGNVFSLNNVDKPTWSFKTGGEISNIISVGDKILVASHDNFVYFLRSKNGARVWKMRLSSRVSDVTTYADSYAFILSADEHRAMFVDLESGKIAGQTLFEDDETAIESLPYSGQFIFVLTSKALNAYALSGCPHK